MCGKWGGRFESSPLQTPKRCNTRLLQFETLGKNAGIAGAKEFFFGLSGRVKNFLTPLTPGVYTPNTQIFVENSKMGEKHENFFDL